jgi:TP901 family phage tail tape measure protein
MAATVHGIKAGKAFILIEAVDKTAKVLDGLKNRIGRWGSELSAMGTTIALRAAMALTPAVFSAKMFADFDDSMRKVEARSKGTAAEMAALRLQAKELGRTSAFTSSQIGELQARLAQFGKSRADILKMTEPIMDLARAGGEGKDLGLDIIQATDAVTQVLAAYRLETAATGRVTDLLTQTVNSSRFTLEELSTALQYAAPAAKRFNVSIEDMLVGVGAIRELGVDASIAGTAFRNMLLYVSQAAERESFNEALQKLTGNVINFTDAAGNLRNPIDMLLAIAEATKDLGNVEAADLFTQLFETRATVPAMGVSESIKFIQRVRRELSQVHGVAARTHKTLESGLGGAFRELASASEAVALSLGEAFSKSLITATQAANRWLKIISEWIDQNKALVTIIFSSIAALGIFGVVMILLGQTMRMLSGLLVLVIVPMRMLSFAVNLVTGIVATLYRGLVQLITGAIIPVTIAFIQLAATVSAQVIGALARLTVLLMEELLVVMVTLPAKIMVLVNALSTLISTWFAAVQLAASVVGWVAAIMFQLTLLGGILLDLVVIAGILLPVLVLIAIAIYFLWEAINTLIQTALDNLNGTLEFLVAVLREVGAGLTNIGSTLAGILGRAIEDITKRVESLRTIWVEAFEEIREAVDAGDLQTAFAVAFSAMKVTAISTFNAIMNAWDDFLERFLNGLTHAANVFTTFAKILQMSLLQVARGWAEMDPTGATSAMLERMIASFGLDEADIQRYQKLMQGVWGVEFPGERELFEQRRRHFEDLKKARDAALRGAEDEFNLLTADEAADTVDEFRELERIGLEAAENIGVDMEDVANRIKGFIGPGGVGAGITPPKANEGIRRESIDAAKAFQENKFALWQTTLEDLVGIAEEQRDHLAAIDTKLEGLEAV